MRCCCRSCFMACEVPMTGGGWRPQWNHGQIGGAVVQFRPRRHFCLRRPLNTCRRVLDCVILEQEPCFLCPFTSLSWMMQQCGRMFIWRCVYRLVLFPQLHSSLHLLHYDVIIIISVLINSSWVWAELSRAKSPICREVFHVTGREKLGIWEWEPAWQQQHQSSNQFVFLFCWKNQCTKADAGSGSLS